MLIASDMRASLRNSAKQKDDCLLLIYGNNDGDC